MEEYDNLRKRERQRKNPNGTTRGPHQIRDSFGSEGGSGINLSFYSTFEKGRLPHSSSNISYPRSRELKELRGTTCKGAVSRVRKGGSLLQEFFGKGEKGGKRRVNARIVE